MLVRAARPRTHPPSPIFACLSNSSARQAQIDMLEITKLRDRLRIDVAVDAASDHNFWCGLTSEIEQGGIFIATHHRIQLGTLVELSVHLPGVDAPASMSGVVRWVREHADLSDGPAGIGIKFTGLEGEMRALVRRFTALRQPLLFELEDPPMRQRRKWGTA
jgi:uncharacterized protein (TIGR02266 family)